VLKIAEINTYYGVRHMLRDVSLEVGDGEVVTVIGTNGSGKTTLLRTISGFIRTVGGAIEYGGERIDGLRPTDIVKLGICHIPEGRQLFPTMSVLENLEMGAYLRRDNEAIEQDLERVYEFFPILQERAKQQAGTLSGGQQQMLAIGRGLMSNPKLLLMDEPSLGLSPALTEQLGEIILRIKGQNIAVLLNEQNANMALNLADEGYVLELGEIVLRGNGDELLHNEEVRKAYLGL
jgi:branched-chain amino acid transport system ATP-binding protein